MAGLPTYCLAVVQRVQDYSQSLVGDLTRSKLRGDMDDIDLYLKMVPDISSAAFLFPLKAWYRRTLTF